MKIFSRTVLAAAFVIAALAPALAQWQVPNYAVPIGRGAASQGFKFAAPGTAAFPLVSNGAAADPTFQALVNAGISPSAAIALTKLANQNANTVVANGTNTAAPPVAFPMPSCSTSTSVLQWLTNTGFQCATNANPQTSATICNLKDQMDITSPGWVYYTTPGSGTNIGPALSACMATFAANQGRGTIVVPAGAWALSTSNIDFAGSYIIGQGSQASVIVFRPPGGVGAALKWSGAGGYTGGGVKGVAISLDSTVGASTAIGLLFQGNATYQPDQIEVDDIYITSIGGVSTWYSGAVFDGSARTAPQGMRVGMVSNVQIFSATNTGVSFNNVVQYTISNLGVYTSTGTGRNIYFAGGGSPTTNTIQVVADGLITNDLNITNSSRIFARGWGTSVSVDATATNSRVEFDGALIGVCGASCTVTAF